MKDKILTLTIGILIGAIIASAGFVIYNKTNKGHRKYDFGEPPQMNQGQDGNQNSGTPPVFPNGEKPSGRPNKDAKNENSQNTTSTQTNEQTQSNS